MRHRRSFCVVLVFATLERPRALGRLASLPGKQQRIEQNSFGRIYSCCEGHTGKEEFLYRTPSRQGENTVHAGRAVST
ncbi:hypothetical protein PISMIDRAFT_678524 [Pisolithus microcarpus 441]|uniref:Unplaced genomic scaffold scaffold_36, whole genome shotgun sequence n=1 Tax=Pisolithus microcarpus 441 TaxID=765257 RepID=A0A0C9YGJ9_9AGAM|nr:hypothetical protein PISMIDRAFT_678524 [Pisolithus microcarpus 441]